MDNKVTALKPCHNFNSGHRKERHFTKEYAAIVSNGRGGLATSVTLRIYHTDTTAYAALWYNRVEIHGSGTGKAGGYGYDRPSAAASAAFRAAGVDLAKNIGGVGPTAIRGAVEALARKLGSRKVHIHEAHP